MGVLKKMFYLTNAIKMKLYVFSIVLFMLFSISVGCSETPIKINTNLGKNNFETSDALDRAWIEVQANAAGIQSRYIAEFLAEAAGRNWYQDRLRTALRNLAALQIRDKSNAFYGNFLWQKGNPLPTNAASYDINGVVFCASQLALLRLKYFDKLNADNKALLDEIIDLSLVALLRDVHDRRAAYTNTWAMRVWSLCGLGEALGRADVLKEGEESLKEWMQHMYQYGIVEYNSGVYTPISIANLGCLANQIENPQIKKEANIALRYFSKVLYGNVFSYDERGATLGGPQSRNYNFVHSRGGSDIICRMMNQSEQNFFNKHAVWVPFPDDLNLYQKRPHLLVYKNGETDNHFVINYLGVNVNMGSAGTTHSSEDKTYVINFSDKTRSAVVHISSVFDGRSDPYGEKLVNGTKPRHLRNYLTARAQRELTSGSEMVFLISGDGSERDDTQILNHYVILPADRHDGMWNGNAKLENVATDCRIALSNEGNKTIFIRFGDAVAGLRYLKAVDVYGVDLNSIYLVNTPNKPQSISAGTAMYIQSQLSNSKPEKGSKGIVAMWWRVKENVTTEAQFREFRDEMINAQYSFVQVGDIYTVKVNTPDGELGVSGDKEAQIQTENFGGLILPEGANFLIDGTDVAPSLFKESSFINK